VPPDPEFTMRQALLLFPLLALTACQSPREACISDATRDLNVVNRLIAETEANLTRGYGVAQRQDIVTRPDICTIENADGTQSTFRCDKQDVVTTEVPVALDLNAERDTLRSLVQQQSALQQRAQASVQFCVASYPDE